MTPIRSFQGVSLAQGSVPDDIGPGLNTSEEVVAAGGTTNTLVQNPVTGSKAAAAAAISGVGFLLVRAATVVDDVSPVQTNWYIPIVAT